MLETLEAVDWAQLTHAGGSASDVPSMIRQLLSDKASVRERAIDERGLWGTLCHQDSVYEATAPSVPFLLELVQAQSVRGRGKILNLLVDFAQGGFQDPDEAEARLLQNAAEQAPAEREQRASEIAWTRQTRAAVRAGRSVYLSLLSDRVLHVRRAALRVLDAACHADGAVVAPVLRVRIADERNRAQRIAFVGALARFKPMTQETWSFLTQLHDRDMDALVRLGAAMALAQIDGSRVSATVEATLLQALVHPDPALEVAYNKALKDDDGHYQSDLLEALRRMDDRGVTTAISAIERELAVHCLVPIEQLPPGRMEVSEGWRWGPDGRRTLWTALEGRSIFPPSPMLSLLESLLQLTLGEAEHKELAVSSLSAQQRTALALLGGCDAAWHYDFNVQHLLFAYGVPHTRDSLRDYLGSV